MKYDETKTFEEAEKHLKAKQNIKPDKRNYYEGTASKGWYNQHYISWLDAYRAYNRATRTWKDKSKK